MRFERLTGYVRSEILGRNLRFLQLPGGDQVEVDLQRKYPDYHAIMALENEFPLNHD